MISFVSIIRYTKRPLHLAGEKAGQHDYQKCPLGAPLPLNGATKCKRKAKFVHTQPRNRLYFSGSGFVAVRPGTDPDTRTLGVIQLAVLNRIHAKPEQATARAITDDLSKLFGERIPDAQIFVTLARLRDRGLVEAVSPLSSEGDPENEANPEVDPRSRIARLPTPRTLRGRRAANMKLTPLGVTAVEQAARILLESASTA